MVRERMLTFLPKFEMYMGGRYVGCISKELTFLSRNTTLIVMAGILRGISWNGITAFWVYPGKGWPQSQNSFLTGRILT